MNKTSDIICNFSRGLNLKSRNCLAFLFFLTMVQSAWGYTLVEEFKGKDFFSHFKFETFDDPTHGCVDYVKKSRADYLGLLSVHPTTGAVRIAVDAKNNGAGRGRASVRLSSKTTFTTGLFIIDVNHIPEGNGTWPAFWSYGPNWPDSGEIDIIEGKNDQPHNQSTLHTGPGCVMPTPDPSQMTGRFIESLNCNYMNGAKGCTTQGAVNSFGPGLNKLGGGVYATLWTNSGIKVWHWSRSQIPTNISSGAAPDPNQWGTPVAYFPFGTHCAARNVVNHKLVLNTTFCGDWAGAEFVDPVSGRRGHDACRYYVARNPKKFVNTYWDINYIRAYSLD